MPDFDSEFFIDYSSLDDFQRQLIDRKNNKSMVVSGSAGSGKSLIALHKAKQIAALGDSYTIIVYTKSLRKYFEDGLRHLGLRNVYHYHQWKHNQRRVKYLIVDECQDFTREEIEEMKKGEKFKIKGFVPIKKDYGVYDLEVVLPDGREGYLMHPYGRVSFYD